MGDGTAESKEKMQNAIDDLWRFTDELFHNTEADKAMISEGIGVDVSKLKETYYQKVNQVLKRQNLISLNQNIFKKEVRKVFILSIWDISLAICNICSELILI